MHEIITLQLGQKSNYLATHFWNFQESYFTYSEHEEPLINHDVHFRAGVGIDGVETYTPRTVIYDLKGGFGSLRRLNALYDMTDESTPIRGLWDGSTLTQLHQPIEQIEYQKRLEQGLPTFQLCARDIRYWSDFNRVYYHPRSIVQLNEYELNSQLMPFENWSIGSDLYRSLDKEFDLLDRDVRPFAEECDQIQGLQIMTTTDDAWGGFSSKYVDDLRDEFGKTSIWVWGMEDGLTMTRQKQLTQTSNTARSLQSMGTLASAYIRITTPPRSLPQYVHLGGTSDWSQTALICSALETSTLATRTRRQAGREATLAFIEAALNTNGKQTIFELQNSVSNDERENTKPHTNGYGPRSEGQDAVMTDTEDSEPVEEASLFDIDFSPEIDSARKSNRSHIFGQLSTSRGLTVQTATITGMSSNERIRRRLNEESVVERFNSHVGFPQLDTFPATLFHFGNSRARNLLVHAGLASTSRTKNTIHQLRASSCRTVAMDERETLYNDLTELADAYTFGWDSGSDSNEDD